MPREIRGVADYRRRDLVDKVLLALWVSTYTVLLFAFGLLKRFEKPSAKA